VSQQRAPREWIIDAGDYENADEFREAVVAELAGLENIGHRLGGAFTVTPIRMRAPDEEQPFTGATVYRTHGWLFSHVFMPAARAPKPPPSNGAPVEQGEVLEAS
jgi:hypothetical protein